MAESTLSIQLSDIRSSVGHFLGYGRDADDWDDDRLDFIDECIHAGCRRFYYSSVPPPTSANPSPAAYRWRFLRPVASETFWASIGVLSTRTVTATNDGSDSTVTANTSIFEPNMVGKSIIITGSGTYTIKSYTSATVIVCEEVFTVAVAATYSIAANGTYILPDDFGGMDSPLTFDSTNGYREIELTNESRIRMLRAESDSTGVPRVGAVRPQSGTTASRGQRYEIMLWPTPDANYDLTYRYNAMPGKLTTAAPYPLGGLMYGEVIMAACVAAAEWKSHRVKGPAEADYQQMLAGAINQDMRMSPDTLGYNGDGDDGYALPRHRLRSHLVTLNGASF